MSGPNVPTAYQPTGSASADQGYQAINANQLPYALNLPGQAIPGIQSAVSGITGNPYTTGYQGGANNAGATYNTLAPQLTGASGNLMLGGNNALSAGNQVLNTAFDPQKALYDQLFQNTADTANATNAQYGLSTSPYGAGTANQALTNFNIDWQNQQLGRQLEGLQGFGSALNTASGAYQGGAGLGQAGANAYLAGGSTPYNTANTIQGNNLNAYNALSAGTANALAPGQNVAQMLNSYLNTGQNATSLNQAAEKQQYGQDNALSSGIGSLLFGPMTNPFQTYGGGSGGGSVGGGGSGAGGSSIMDMLPAMLAMFGGA